MIAAAQASMLVAEGWEGDEDSLSTNADGLVARPDDVGPMSVHLRSVRSLTCTNDFQGSQVINSLTRRRLSDNIH